MTLRSEKEDFDSPKPTDSVSKNELPAQVQTGYGKALSAQERYKRLQSVKENPFGMPQGTSMQLLRKRKYDLDRGDLKTFRMGYTPLTSILLFKKQYTKFAEKTKHIFESVDDENRNDSGCANNSVLTIPDRFSVDDCVVSSPSELIESCITDSVTSILKDYSNNAKKFRANRYSLSDFVKTGIKEDGECLEPFNINSNSDIEEEFPRRGRPRKKPKLDSSSSSRLTLTEIEFRRKQHEMKEYRLERSKLKDKAMSVPVCSYSALTPLFDQLRNARAEYAAPRTKKEINGVTRDTLLFKINTIRDKTGFEQITAGEVILRVSVYNPTDFTKILEYQLLGSHSLQSLKDSIYCLNDKVLGGASSPSGYFFIENTFYDSLNHENSIRYSDNVIKWVKLKNRYRQEGLARFDAKTMEETRFEDLSIRLGSHYLYCHQGDCQHVIIFNEMRILNKQDVQNAKAYPLLIFSQRLRRQKCGVCSVYPAKYAAYGDKLAPENPFFYCDRCYQPLHYNKDGELHYDDFRVYPYEHE